jgi:hypothetical protein
VDKVKATGWRRLAGGAVAALATAGVLVPTVAGAAEGPVAVVERTMAVGETLTVSGTNCLYDGQPGDLLLGLGRHPDLPEIPALISGYVKAQPNGDWSITATIPEAPFGGPGDVDKIGDGDWTVIVLCDNPAKHGYFHSVPGDVNLLHIKGKVTPSTTTTTAAPSPTRPMTTTTKPAPRTPAAVKATPRFTG